MPILREVRQYTEAMATFWFSTVPDIATIDGVTDAVFDGVLRGLGDKERRAGNPLNPDGIDAEDHLPCISAAREFGPLITEVEGVNIERDQIKTIVASVHGHKKDRVKSDGEICNLCHNCESIKVLCNKDTCPLCKEGKSEDSEDVKEKAREILEHGDPMTYIADACGQMVLGAETAFRKLICCVGVQSINQSAGLHPKLNGESGSGKSWAVTTFAHHLPKDAVSSGSSSNLALFYHDQGDRLFRILDDYRAGNETLDTIMKQTTTVYHQKYAHRTVVRQAAKTLYAGSEQTWAVTSVDASQDIQVLNRQIPINLDDGVELTQQVNQHTISRYGRGAAQFSESEDVQVCREMWRILRGEGYVDIRVPFYERIEWLDNTNRRNPSIFMDLVVAHTYMNLFQREQDADGFYLATEADFEAAKALFCEGSDADELIHRLTKKERQFCELLKMHHGGMTRHEVATAMGVSNTRISQLARGEKGGTGLSQKLPGFDAKEVLRRENDVDTVKVNVYVLEGFNSLSGFDSVVRLKPNSLKQSKGGKQGVRKRVSKETSNISSIVSSSKDSKEKERLTHSPVETEDKDCSLLSNPENPYSPYSDSKRPDNQLTPSLPDLTDLTEQNSCNPSISQELAQAEARQKEHEEHFKTPRKMKPDDQNLVPVLFLEDVPRFASVDGRNYGPFTAQDMATIPQIHARNLERKEALRIHPNKDNNDD